MLSILKIISKSLKINIYYIFYIRFVYDSFDSICIRLFYLFLQLYSFVWIVQHLNTMFIKKY